MESFVVTKSRYFDNPRYYWEDEPMYLTEIKPNESSWHCDIRKAKQYRTYGKAVCACKILQDKYLDCKIRVVKLEGK